jgi:hypothetical protein
MLILIALTGCGEYEKSAWTEDPINYEKNSLSFNYPRNWKVTEDEQYEEYRLIYVETPGETMVVIQVYPDSVTLDMQEYAREFSRETNENTTTAKFSESNFSSVVKKNRSESLKERFSVKFLGVSVQFTRHYKCKNINGHPCVFIFHVPDEDHSMVESGFKQIVSTFDYDAL